MLLTEQDTLRAISVAKANPDRPEVIAKAKAVAAAYKRQQEAAGQPLFPEAARAKEQAAATVRGFYTDRERHGLPEATFQSLNENFREAPEEKYRLFNRKFFEQAGIPRDRSDALADELISEYSRKTWGEEVRDHRVFADRLGKDFEFEDAVSAKALESAMSNVRNIDALSAFGQENAENPVYKGRERQWQDQFLEGVARTRSKLAPYQPTVRAVAAILQAKTGTGSEGTETESYRELAERIMEVPKEDRKFVISAVIAAGANDEAGRKGVAKKLAESFGRGLLDYSENIPATSERSWALGVRSQIEAGFPISAEDAGDPGKVLSAATAQLTRSTGAGISQFGDMAPAAELENPGIISDEVRGKALDLADKLVESIDLRAELRSVAENEIDPISSDWIAMRGLYSATRSMPYTLASIAPGGFFLNSLAMSETSYQRLRAENPDMTAGQAQALSAISGPIQAWLERISGKILTGRLPAFNRFANQVTVTKGAAARRFGARLGAVAGIEQAQENAQDLTPFAIQGAVSALNEDVPGVPWDAISSQFSAENQGELFFAILPLALIGAGVGTVRDYRGAREMLGSYEMLRAVGLSEAAASEVRAKSVADDVAGAQSLLRQEFATIGADQKTLTEARNEAIPKLLQERERVRELVNKAGDLDMLPAIRNEGGGMWSLQYSDGSGLSFQSYEEADARRWQVASDENLSLHEDTIATIRQLDAAIEAGRETKYLFSLDDPTVADKKASGEITDEQAAQRVRISEAQSIQFSKSNPVDDRPTLHRVFEGGSPIRVTGNGVLQATDSSKAFRITGRPQFDDIAASGQVRAKVGKMRGGRYGETQWSRGHESLGYRADSNKGRYVIVAPAEGLNGLTGGLPLSSVTSVYESDGMQWNEVSAELWKEYEAARTSAELAGATAEDRAATARILGQSVNEFRDEVIRTTVRLFQGATPLTLIEEKTEGDAKFMIGQLGLRKWMLSSLRGWEKSSGDKLFRKVGEGEENDQDIVEAWSALTQAYFVGRSKKGDQGPVFQGSRKNIAKLLSSPLGSAMTGYARLFRAVWRRAAMIEKARRDGTFDGDLEDFLARSTGISEQRLFERDVVREGAALASQISGNVSDNAASGSSVSDNGPTFSLLPSSEVSETDTEYLAAVERGDMETAQRLVDEAARAAGYGAKAYHGTNSKFDVFDFNRRSDTDRYGEGWAFFTTSISLAEEYASLGSSELRGARADMWQAEENYEKITSELLGDDANDLSFDKNRYHLASLNRKLDANEITLSQYDQWYSAFSIVWDAQKAAEQAEFISYNPEVIGAYLNLGKSIKKDAKVDGGMLAGYDVLMPEIAKRAKDEGADSFIVTGVIDSPFGTMTPTTVYAVKSPNQIKSADPVTYDAQGNVIPLSQRFNPASDEITYSLLPDASNLDAEFGRMFSPFHRSPELRMRLGQEMRRRATDEVGRNLEKILRANRTKKDIEAERKKRQDELFSEKLDTLSAGEIAALSNQNLLEDNSLQPILSELLIEQTRVTKTGRKVRYWTGSLMSKSEAKRRGIDTTGGEWDAIPEGLPPYVWGGSLAPDQAASMFNFERPEEFFDTLASEIQSRADRKAEIEAANRRIRELEREAREESRAWAEKALEERETVGTDRATLLGFLRALEAIKRALPAEVRGKIGGSVALAQLTRPAAMLDEIESRVEMIDRELERWMQKEATEQVEAFFEKVDKSKQDEAGKAAKGKKNLPEIYKVMALSKKAFKTMSAEEGQSEGLRLHGLVDSGAVADDDVAATLMAAELIPLFSGWNGKTRNEVIDGKTKRIRISEPSDSAQKTAALEAAKRIWTEGVLEWKKRQAEIKERRDSIRTQGEADIAKASKLRTRDEQEILSKGRASLPGKFALNIQSFDGFFRWHLGDKSSVYQWITDSERKAANAYDDAVRNISKSVDEWFTKKAGSRFKGEKLRQKLAETRVKITPEKGEVRELSQLQLITAKLIWRQEDGKRHMKGRRDDEGNIVSSWSYSEGFMAQVDAAISEDALELMDFLSDAYDAEYEPLNRVYRRLFGIDLPKHLLYSPLTMKPEIKGDAGSDPVTGFFSGGLSGIAGALKTRGTSIAEPDFKDALQVYVAHSMQMEHFKAFAELARDARAIFGRVSFRDQIKRASGDEGVTILDGLLEVLDKGGIRSSGVYLETTKTLEKLTGRLSTMILFGKLQTIALNVTQLAAAAVEMGPRTYWKQFGKLWFTPTDWVEALRTPYIQRRIAEMPPVIRQAIESGKKLGPSRLADINDKLGYGISASDGFFTAGTYAMVYDWKKQEAARLGIAPESVEEFARNETERIMDRLAQPTRKGARSIFENNMGVGERALFNFFSDARKNFALLAYAYGKDPSKIAGTSMFIVFSALISTLIRATWQDLRDDDEDEDGVIWNPGKLALEIAIDPVYGIPVVGGMLQDAVKAGFGFKTYSGTILESGKSAIPAARRLVAMDYDPEEIDRLAGDVNAILGAFGYFSRDAAALTSITNAVEDALKVYDNLTSE